MTVRPPMPRALLALLPALLLSTPAEAHIVASRLGDFYAGALHPLTGLVDVLLWAALGLLAGMQPPGRARWLVLLFPLGLLAGLLLGLHGTVPGGAVLDAGHDGRNRRVSWPPPPGCPCRRCAPWRSRWAPGAASRMPPASRPKPTSPCSRPASPWPAMPQSPWPLPQRRPSSLQDRDGAPSRCARQEAGSPPSASWPAASPCGRCSGQRQLPRLSGINGRGRCRADNTNRPLLRPSPSLRGAQRRSNPGPQRTVLSAPGPPQRKRLAMTFKTVRTKGAGIIPAAFEVDRSRPSSRAALAARQSRGGRRRAAGPWIAAALRASQRQVSLQGGWHKRSAIRHGTVLSVGGRRCTP